MVLSSPSETNPKALNEGRKRHMKGGQGDKDFGAWVVAYQLDGPDWMERLAAMWAAGNP